MVSRMILINGVNQQIEVCQADLEKFNFLAVDQDGEVWFFRRKPIIRDDNIFRGFVPQEPRDGSFSGEKVEDVGEVWRDSLTKINSEQS